MQPSLIFNHWNHLGPRSAHRTTCETSPSACFGRIRCAQQIRFSSPPPSWLQNRSRPALGFVCLDQRLATAAQREGFTVTA
jgi:hypothetical protein